MSVAQLYPLKLQPTLHVKVWGGRRLEALLNKDLPTEEPFGESWELHDSAVVSNGPLAGQSLGSVMRDFGAELVGHNFQCDQGFPLLAKFIDAERWLSIQVHPDDAQARRLEGEPRGKTEAWVVLHAEPGAQLVIGIRPQTARAQLEMAIRSGQVEDLLQYAEAEAGDVLYIPANTVHALGPGLLIYEIQQSSDTTYRLYDWGRMGLDGAPRPLHIEKGLGVANLESLPTIKRPAHELIIDGEFFSTWRHRLQGDRIHVATNERFQALTCIDGEVQVAVSGEDSIELAKGETGLIPACIPEITMNGIGTILQSCENDPAAV